MNTPNVFRDSFTTGNLLLVPPDGSLAGVANAAARRPQAPLPKTPQEFQTARAALLEMLAKLDTSGDLSDGGVQVRDSLLDGVPALLFEPPQMQGALLHIHGGGFCMGSPSMMRKTLTRWSGGLGLAIASLDYRLAPEHRCPAAQDDCERGALAWIDDVRRRAGRLPIGIAGESAGAHLAAVTAIRLRRSHDFRFDSALLTYGHYDFVDGLPSRTIADSYPGLMNSASCSFFAHTYLADAKQALDADVSPLRAKLESLRDLPPALFVGGTLDPLLDDSILMHDRWIRADNRSWLALYGEAPHGFDIYGGAQSRHLEELRRGFLSTMLIEQR